MWLRTLARQREQYLGEWLPEPVLTSPDVAADVQLAKSVSIAMLGVLATLLPTERAVFVLREVSDVPYDEIAEALDKSPAAVRQIATRARRHVAARRPRMSVSRTEQQQVVERFLAALTTGDVPGLLEVLAPDVLVVGDGGGLAPTIPKPVRGAAKLAPVMARFAEVVPGARAVIVDLNGGIAARTSADDGRVGCSVGARAPWTNTPSLGRMGRRSLLTWDGSRPLWTQATRRGSVGRRVANF